jgi:predicted aspartyl protease
MKKTRMHAAGYAAIISMVVLIESLAASGTETGRQREEVNWQAGAGRRIKAITYPKDRKPQLEPARRSAAKERPAGQSQAKRKMLSSTGQTGAAAGILVQTIDVNSPPVAGFTPWIAISVTNARSSEDDYAGVPVSYVTGSYPSGVNADTDFIIGVYDTGASGHVFGYANAQTLGFFRGSLVTKNETTISGVTGSVDASISYPLGVFINGLHAINIDTLKLNRTGMVGETNVAVMVGQNPGTSPDLLTAVGSPMSVYYTAVFYNDQPITLTLRGIEYTGPDIRVYEDGDPCIPAFSNTIPLELRPLGGVSVMYMPPIDLGLGWDDLNLDDILNGDFGTSSTPAPSSPSIIMGNSSQSLFFVSSVDLYDGNDFALDKNRFMLDTGAQVSVIGSRIAARLRINPAKSDFDVEIEDVTGELLTYPGFFIDKIELPALGNWATFRNVPVVLLDVSSPEGGTLDGIIGMNLFSNFNLKLKGGSMVEDPSFEFEPIAAAGPE